MLAAAVMVAIPARIFRRMGSIVTTLINDGLELIRTGAVCSDTKGRPEYFLDQPASLENSPFGVLSPALLVANPSVGR